MTTRPMFRTALTLLSVPALAGLMGVCYAQSLASAESTGQPPDRIAARQAAQLLIGTYPISMNAIRQAIPAESALVRGGRLLRMTAPSYPAAARHTSVSGVVTVEALIGVDGRVVRTSVLRGPISLRLAAQNSVRNWRYEPTLLNGKPVERLAEVDMRFVLGRY